MGEKLNLLVSPPTVSTMVFLSQLSSQFPWNLNAEEDYSDKEIYTFRVSLEDASDSWRVPLLEPIDGFAFVGVRVTVFGQSSEYTMVPRLVQGATTKAMFGLPWDQTVLTNGAWAPLGFPLTHKMLAISEDSLDLLIRHTEPCWGRVDVLAQRFEDLMEDETGIQYAFLNHRTDKIEWILSETNLMYKPTPMDGPVLRGKTKLIPSVLRLLDFQRAVWSDRSLWKETVNLPAPLLE